MSGTAGAGNAGVVAAGGAVAGAGAGGVASGAGGGSAPWYSGVDPEILGHWQTKGWHEKPAHEVAVLATQAHRQAEKFVGIPADQMLRVPKDAADEAGWKAVWGRLGAPADASGYDLSAVRFSDGKPVNEEFASWFKARAAAAHLPKDAATGLAAEFVKYIDGAAATDAAETAAALAGEQQALRQNWGANYEGLKLVARRAAEALGVTPEQITALEGVVGYAKTMDMFRQIGAKIGEDKFVSGGSASPGVMTREQALARVAELKADQGWVKRYLSGDAAANREMTAMLTLVTAGAENTGR